LEEKLNGTIASAGTGIAHTRWATHGVPTEANAHPHADCTGTIFIVHNGIIENYQTLRKLLTSEGHVFRSDTDSEILAHLIEKCGRQVPLELAVLQALRDVLGTFALAVVSTAEPQKLVVARRSSPLLIGIGAEETFVASDASAIMPHTRRVLYLNDDEAALITPGGVSVRTLHNRSIQKAESSIDWSAEEAERNGFAHFMAKEIHEGPGAIENALRGRVVDSQGSVQLDGLESVASVLRETRRIVLVSCGTSYFAGLAGGLMLEEHADVPTEVIHASEFRYRSMPFDPNTAVVAISQSGETADTLAAVQEAKRRGLLTLGVVNVVGSSIARETDAGVYNHAGPEIGVASTKSFLSQLSVLALLAVYLGRMRSMDRPSARRILRGLRRLPDGVRRILEQEEKIRALAERYVEYENFLYIGRKYQFPTALEGALKLKEISYIHAEGFPAGEMKHGPIALITKRVPTVALAPSDSMYGKMVSNISEIRSREGPVLALATEGNEDIRAIASDVFHIPATLEMLAPLLAVIPLQLLAYHIAVLRGCDVDKPRNLAKSVTVE
jgi:glucosamine--fructose-6-phosphate aminotransferase (isomerizing)